MTAIPVLISLKSTAHREEAAEDERMSMLTSGTLEVDDTKAVIRYEESIDESLPPQPAQKINIKQNDLNAVPTFAVKKT
jgi:uncharacterized beta-barrel protein YwiB (DUF1934 family)